MFVLIMGLELVFRHQFPRTARKYTTQSPPILGDREEIEVELFPRHTNENAAEAQEVDGGRR